MTYKTLISAEQLSSALTTPSSTPFLIFDCSFDLTNTSAGEASYKTSHIPNAHYVHLDRDLSTAKTGLNGRHPLPTREAFAATMGRFGLTPATQVVAYDNAGSMYAARFWWMLRWLGHEAVAVIDGGLAAWKAAGKSVTADPTPEPQPNTYKACEPLTRSVTYAELRAGLGSAHAPLVLDARAPDRFRGENETLDPVAGHIPNARNHLFKNNLGEGGYFKSPSELKAQFDKILAGGAPAEVVNQCGSGVTACHNLLALEVAGLAGSALYPGSWSEWCAQPDTVIATGDV